MATYVLLRLLAVILLVAANAFFVAAEFALVSVRDTRIQQLIEARRIGARTVQKLQHQLDSVLNGVQFGITLASLALGWIGEPALANLLHPLFEHLPHAGIYAHTGAVVIAFTLITYLHVILGEVVPKTVALQRAEQVALAIAGPMDVFMRLATPFLYVMTNSARGVLKIFGMRDAGHGGIHSPEEIKLIVTATRRYGLLSQSQEEMIIHSLELSNITVREIMVARPNIFSLPADLSLEEALTRVVEEQHSRVPVYDPQRGPEHIVGLLYSKDLTRWMRLRLLMKSDATASARLSRMQVRHIMRDVLVIPETKVLTELLTEFKQRKRHLAVVVDEFGSTAGVVTVEDVLEQIVGEIEDEFDITPQPLAPGATTMVFEGSVPIRDLETQYQLRLPRDEGFETLAGFVLTQLQRIPRGGECFEYDGRRYTVEEMDGHRIARVKIDLAPRTADADSAEKVSR
ncbi:MAG TPA: hemolysin family protein [Terriglobales bacterium]|nr:hemolysin family protein [Terriglobales bacterium]